MHALVLQKLTHGRQRAAAALPAAHGRAFLLPRQDHSEERQESFCEESCLDKVGGLRSHYAIILVIVLRAGGEWGELRRLRSLIANQLDSEQMRWRLQELAGVRLWAPCMSGSLS